MSQIEDVLRGVLIFVGVVLVLHGATLFEVAYQATNPIYSAFSCIIEIFVGLALIVLGLSKKPEKVLETIADFLQDVLDRIS